MSRDGEAWDPRLVDADGFDYVTSEDVLEECKAQVGEVGAPAYSPSAAAASTSGEDTTADDIDKPLYSVDALVRRAPALQLTPAARRAAGEGGA